MITLPEPLEKVMRSGNLEGIKPFAVLIRNKWHEESGGDSYFALDTDNPIDITQMIVKPNTLSMTLDVNEVAQYKANNVTLTIYDPFNKFIEGTPQSYFPQGYQLYGSQVILYYGLDDTNRTPLFVGIIRDFPTHKPEQYQVDLTLISPLELLNDIETKDFSNKYIGEVLTAEGNNNNNPVYKTANVGVGGFNAVYANGNKIFDGIDYEVSQANEMYLPALVTIINADLHSATITADYYCWKTGLTVEQIVSGLVALAGYINNTDIQPVVWQTAIRNPSAITPIFASLGYYEDAPNEFLFNWQKTFNNKWSDTQETGSRKNIMPNNFDLNFTFQEKSSLAVQNPVAVFCIGDEFNTAGEIGVKNGLSFCYERLTPILSFRTEFRISQIINGTVNSLYSFITETRQVTNTIKLEKRNNTISIYVEGVLVSTVTDNSSYNFNYQYGNYCRILNQSWNFYDNNTNLIAQNLTNPCIISQVIDKGNDTYPWGEINASLTQGQDTFALSALSISLSNDNLVWSEFYNYDLGNRISRNDRYLRYILAIANTPNNYFNIKDPNIFYFASNLLINFVNLSGKTVLASLEDFALISGYEFGVNKNGVFFFRPRIQNTNPLYNLDHNEIVKVNTIKRTFNDFFTKLTLNFAERPLEFYANEGEKPTPVDRYGVINKEINKPDIVNYDNPELAQAIGPQLLAIYSNLSDVIQLVGKLNLSLELGDVVNVKRNYNLTVPDDANDYSKFINQNTYYQACKITGLNYNFSKRQITYTLHNVSNENNQPQYEFDEFIYDFQVPLGVKE